MPLSGHGLSLLLSTSTSSRVRRSRPLLFRITVRSRPLFRPLFRTSLPTLTACHHAHTRWRPRHSTVATSCARIATQLPTAQLHHPPLHILHRDMYAGQRHLLGHFDAKEEYHVHGFALLGRERHDVSVSIPNFVAFGRERKLGRTTLGRGTLGVRQGSRSFSRNPKVCGAGVILSGAAQYPRKLSPNWVTSTFASSLAPHGPSSDRCEATSDCGYVPPRSVVTILCQLPRSRPR